MKLSHKFKPKLNEMQLAILEKLSFHTTKLYNIANYENLINGVRSYVEMEAFHKSSWHVLGLHSHNYQQCLKVLEKNWKSYLKSIADFKKNPEKYKGMPMPPKFKNVDKRKNEIIFTKAGIRLKGNALLLSLSKSMQEEFKVQAFQVEASDKLQHLVDFSQIQQIKVQWDFTAKAWYFVLIYNKEAASLPDGFNNIMGIDLGLNNLAALSFADSYETYLLNGKPLKSVNSHINKQIAHLQSISMSMTGSKKHKDTHQIAKLRKYRENYIKDYLHKSSTKVVELAMEHHCSTILIGDLKNIKHQMNYNKTFVQIPLQMFVNMVKYKAALKGIAIQMQEESYTSGCSALDLEPISADFYNKRRRICRGLFQSNTGILLNSDVNGSLNILRKATSCIPKLVSAMDKGFVKNPVKLQAV